MVGRLKNTLKTELEALKNGTPMPATTSADGTAPKKATPRKRKGKEDTAGADEANGDADGSPKKRGRPKKAAAVPAADEDEGEVKSEVKEEAEEV